MVQLAKETERRLPKRTFSTVREATSALRKTGFKPSLNEGGRVWKRVANDALITATIDLKESGVCKISIT